MSEERTKKMGATPEERKKYYAAMRRKRRRRQRIITIVVLLAVLAALIAGVFAFGSGLFKGKLPITTQKAPAKTEETTDNTTTTEETTEAVTETASEAEDVAVKKVIKEADAYALTYDYDKAIKTVKASELYSSSNELQEKATKYQEEKDACVEIKPEEVTHIFYHTLVRDPSKAFIPGEAGYDGWQQWMTTIDEFDKITQSMYDKGFVLVSIHDLVEKSTDSEGKVTISPKSIYLPEGKKAFVLSLDDLSYYHTYDNHGVASRLVLDADGKPTCEYIEDDGSLSYGDYDVVPRMDTFLEEHPDGCYKGARGIIALTGYNGVLGYRTDGTYDEAHNENSDVYFTDPDQEKWLEAHPDYDFEQEVKDAQKVAEAMKAEGWEFASHTWGHKNIGQTGYDEIVRDTERWLKYVGPIVGEIDTIIFAFGSDITTSGTYTHDDAIYMYLKEKGFDLYCNVDSGKYTTVITEEYLHQGRRNLDGYRIYNDSIAAPGESLTEDLYDAAEVLDPARPLPVPDL